MESASKYWIIGPSLTKLTDPLPSIKYGSTPEMAVMSENTICTMTPCTCFSFCPQGTQYSD